MRYNIGVRIEKKVYKSNRKTILSAGVELLSRLSEIMDPTGPNDGTHRPEHLGP